MKKKVLVWVLSICMVFTQMPLSVFADTTGENPTPESSASEEVLPASETESTDSIAPASEEVLPASETESTDPVAPASEVGGGNVSFEDFQDLIDSSGDNGSITLGGDIELSSKVARIGEDYYDSLKSALEAAVDGSTIVVEMDLTLTKTLTIPSGKNITLDLNGKTISQTKAQTGGYEMILNDGNLTIVDNSDSKAGKISYTDSGNGGEYQSNTITNRGTLTLKSGTVENLSSSTVANNGYPYAIDTSIWGDATEVNTIIEGGKVYCESYSAMRMRGDSNTEAVNVTVNGGKVVGTIEVQNSSNVAKGKLTITGGELSNSGTANVLFFFGSGNTAMEAEITGGEFTGAVKFSTGSNIGENFNKKFIKGGTFTSDVSEYVAKGYEFKDGTVEPAALPNATVNKLGKITVKKAAENSATTFKNSYFIHNLVGSSGDGDSTKEFDLQIAMQFIAQDDEVEAAQSAYADYITDFYITFDGLENDSFVADGCYLAGYYPSFDSWVKIPMDGFTVHEGEIYPVITSAGFNFTYEDICTTVGNFVCGIYIDEDILNANPEMKVKLELGLSEESLVEAEEKNFLEVNEHTYSVNDMMDYVAKIGEQGYPTLQAAIGAAKAGETVEIIADEVVFEENAASIVIDKAITIKGAGKDNTKLIFNSATSAFVVKSSNVVFEDLTIEQSLEDNSFLISISKGSSSAPAIKYSDITIKNIDFIGGDYALCLIGEDVVVDNCTFEGQDSHNIIVYSLKGESKITDNVFNASNKNNSSAIYFEGGYDGATDLTNFIGGGTLTIDGNTANSKGILFLFTNWNLVKEMNVAITNNKVDAFTNKAVAIDDTYSSKKASGDEFASFIVSENVFTNVPAGRTIVKEYSGKVTVDASGNYLGSETPDYNALLVGEKVIVDSYYSDEAMTNLVKLGVAQIGDETYRTLQDAIDAAQAGDTVTVISDITLENTVNILNGDNVTLDLNGKTIDGTERVRIAIMSYGDLTVMDSSKEQTGVIKAGMGTAGNAINICGGTFTFESGNIYSKNNAILIDEQAAIININGGKITAEPNTNESAVLYVPSTSNTVINITGGEMVGFTGIKLWNNTKMNITGGNIEGKGGLGILGNGSKDNTEINISGSSTISGKETAIYHPQGGILTIADNVTLTGDTGIVVKGGNVTISGGTINGIGPEGAYAPKSSGFNGTGDALYIEHYDNSTNSENYGTPVVTVTGGTFSSANGKAVASYVNTKNDIEALGGFISGGVFSNAVPEVYCAEGYIPTKISDDTYGVKVGSYVAKIGNNKYETFDEAYTAAKNGDTIELLDTIVITNFKNWINYSKKNITVTYAGTDTAFRVQDGAYVWFGGMTVESAGAVITVEGARTNVEFYGGTYNGTTSAIVANAGNAKIIDGTFKVAEGNYANTIICAEDADVSIQAGKFYNYKPDASFIIADRKAVEGEDGYWTVVEKEYVAKIGNNKYESLDEALAAAKAEDIVMILKNVEEKDFVNVPVDVTLDLNGFKLTANYLASFGNVVDNSTTNTGILNVPAEYILLQKDNAQLPVKTPEGYKFFAMLKFVEGALENNLKYAFKPYFEVGAHDLIDDGAAASGVTVNAQVSWKLASDNNGKRVQDFVYNDKFVSDYIASYNDAKAKYDTMFTLKFSSIDNLMNLTYKTVVRSELGVEFVSPGLVITSENTL